MKFNLHILSTLLSLLLRIVQSTIRLLTDEQSDVRKMAAIFVGNLPWLPSSIDCLRGEIHPSYALSALFDHVMPEFLNSPVCMRVLFVWLGCKQNVENVFYSKISG